MGIAVKLSARRYDTAEPFEYEVDRGRIVAARPLATNGNGISPENRLPWIAPSLVDLQVNGYGGIEFSSPAIDSKGVRAVADAIYSQGVGRFCPTVTTAPIELLTHSLKTIAVACASDPNLAERMPGIHLEGPFISAIDGPRGAHPANCCHAPDWDEFQRLQHAAGGRIRLITLSPEYDEAPEFIRRAVAKNIIVSIGHTAADSRQIRAAVDAGARLSTHLGNGSHGSLRRHPNYIWDQLADDRLTATLIVDGHHLPPEVAQTFVRAKGAERIILISDLSAMAGLPKGRYSTQLCDLEIVADGRIVLAGQDQLLAGAGRPLAAGIANIMKFAAVDLRTAVDMASRRPAGILGLEVCELRPGDRADFILLKPGLEELCHWQTSTSAAEFARAWQTVEPRGR